MAAQDEKTRTTARGRIAECNTVESARALLVEVNSAKERYFERQMIEIAVDLRDIERELQQKIKDIRSAHQSF
ncbi:hypothetical protein KW796_01245 [Candidatus Parcubacteria bacterium]|nr:hypothetical protein [Candidatus Parcubacteria bacterium]